MRILFVNSLTPLHGSTVRSRALVQSLRDLGHDVTYLESDSDSVGKGVVSVGQGAGAAGYLQGTLVRGRYSLISRYDLCFIQKMTPLTALSIAGAKMRRKRLIIDWDDLDSEFQASAARKRVTALVERLAPRYADCVTTHSRLLGEYARLFTKSPVELVPQVVDTDTFDPRRYDRELIRKERGWDNKIVAVFVCTFTQGGAGDLDIVVEAMRGVCAQDKRVRLLLIGGGTAYRDWEKRIRAMPFPECELTGVIPQEEVARMLAGADIGLVFMRDTMGNRMRVSLKALEYLAMEKKIIGCLVGESHTLLQACYRQSPPTSEGLKEEVIAAVRSGDYASFPAGREHIVKNHALCVMRKKLETVIASCTTPRDVRAS